MVGQRIANDVWNTILVVAEIDISGILQILYMALQDHTVFSGMAFHAIVVITIGVGIIPTGIWRFHESNWNTGQQLVLYEPRQ